MCGRYAITLPPDAVRAWFAYRDQPNFPPRYNIAPTQPVPVVLLRSGERRFALMRWGLIPSWVKDLKGFPLLFNIRSETAREKSASRASFQYRRCVLPADGFYEWRKTGRGPAQPFLIRRRDGNPIAFAGLWDTRLDPNGSEVDSAAILTMAAAGRFATIHERCPVMLGQEGITRWMDPDTKPNEAEALIQAPTAESFEFIPIGLGVNKVAADDPSIQEPAPSAVDTTATPVETSSRQGSLF